MAILSLFDTCGLIVGPLMWLAGLYAIWRCVRASGRSSPLQVRRKAAIYSLLPFVVGIAGAIFGFVVWQAAGQQVGNRDPWADLGKVCLAGFVVTSLPLFWSLVLLTPASRQGANA